MAKISGKQLDEIIEYINGTCHTLDEVVNQITEGEFQESDLTEEQISKIDNEIFLCEECGWWDEISDKCNETENCGGEHCIDCCYEEED